MLQRAPSLFYRFSTALLLWILPFSRSVGAGAKSRLRNPVTSTVFLLLYCSRFYYSRAAPGAA
jgi:hypothetical protein